MIAKVLKDVFASADGLFKFYVVHLLFCLSVLNLQRVDECSLKQTKYNLFLVLSTLQNKLADHSYIHRV